MDSNTKSLLKNTILGLVSGGALSALYTLHKKISDDKESASNNKDEISVPLSKKNFMKSVRKPTDGASSAVSKQTTQDVSKLTPQELAALKKSLLRKTASKKVEKVEKKAQSLPTTIKEKNVPASSVSTVRKTKNANYGTIRNTKGQFSNESRLSKSAGIMGDAGGTMADIAGATGGFFVGMSAVKYIADRIIVNRKKKQLEKSRKTYVNMLNKEINDEDAPYYSKAAGDRSLTGTALGLAGLAGVGTAGIAGLVVYRIMENRRKEEERELDRDLSKYPAEKIIKYKFASSEKQKDKPSFFA